MVPRANGGVIRLAVPHVDEADIESVAATLRSGYLVQGERVRAFEEQVRTTVGTQHAVAVSNCTAALHLALLALDVGPGDSVAVTTYSWPATANVIALCGAEPLFVDIDPRTYNLDPERLEAVLASRNVKVVMPVHAFGGMADMPRILALAARSGAAVVEDAACALGARLDDRPAGSWGVMGCFSFHPRKAVTTGEGGAITTDDAHLARRLSTLRNHGLDPAAAAPDFVLPGYNLRLTEFQAALGLTQMGKLACIIERRRVLASRYDTLFAGSGVTVPHVRQPTAHVYQSYVVLLPEDAAPRRSEIIVAMRERGIEVTIGTYHMPLTSYFRRHRAFAPGHFPATDDVAARAVSLPIHSFLDTQQQERVAAELLALLEPSR